MTDPIEGAQLTPEQQADRFLALTREEQVAWMEVACQNAETATACHLLDHDGAEIFARNHTCRTYQEGWDDAVGTLLAQYTEARQKQDATETT